MEYLAATGTIYLLTGENVYHIYIGREDDYHIFVGVGEKQIYITSYLTKDLNKFIKVKDEITERKIREKVGPFLEFYNDLHLQWKADE